MVDGQCAGTICHESASSYKGKGGAEHVKNRRSVKIAMLFAKCHQKFLRGRLRACMKAHYLDCQYGGIEGRGADLCTIAVQAVIQKAIRSNNAMLTLFVDIRNAFYTVIRPLVLPMPGATWQDHWEMVEESIKTGSI